MKKDSAKTATGESAEVEEISRLAAEATNAAYKRALAGGVQVLITLRSGERRLVNPDGTYEVLGKTKAFKRYKKGTIITI